MARVPDFKRIAKEDFDETQQPLIEKLAYPINSFFEQVRNAFNKNIDFTNINQEIIEFTVQVDVNGNPLTPLQFKSTLRTTVQGMTCIRGENLTSLGIPVVNTPFATFSPNGNIVVISNIKGLTANERYKLRFLTYG